ncbi:MAG: peptidoglycan-binding domain-containing protein [Stackebrandtia sp.]
MRFSLTKGRIIGAAVTTVLIGATATAWWVAADARTPAQQAAESEEPPDSVITAPAEEKELLELLTLDGEVQRADELKVEAPAGGGGGGEEEENTGGNTLVSKLPKKKGDEVNAGDVLIELNGRPYFVLPGKIPAYRDLQEGHEGPDVEQLQTALQGIYGTPVTGKFDSRTATDVARLYQDHGYTPGAAAGGGDEVEEGEEGSEGGGDVVTVPAAEVFFAEELPLSVGKVSAELGAPVEGEMLKLVSGKWKVEAEIESADLKEWVKLKKSQPITFGSGPLEGEEAPEPEFEEVKEGEGEGEEEGGGGEEETKNVVIFDLGDKVKDGDPGDSQEIVAEKVKSPEGALVVPASAVWTASDGTEKIDVVDGSDIRSVEVEVHVDYEGEIAVTPVDGDLADGDEVVIARRDRDAK